MITSCLLVSDDVDVVYRDVDDDDGVTAQKSSSLPTVTELYRSADDADQSATDGNHIQRLGGSLIDVTRNAAAKTSKNGDEYDDEDRLTVVGNCDGESQLDNNCLAVSSPPLLQPYKRRLVEPQRERFLTAYERLSYELASDKRCMREITLGKRVGFYQLRNQIGSGNFSTVKLGVHILTRGQLCVYVSVTFWP